MNRLPLPAHIDWSIGALLPSTPAMDGGGVPGSQPSPERLSGVGTPVDPEPVASAEDVALAAIQAAQAMHYPPSHVTPPWTIFNLHGTPPFTKTNL